MLTGTPLQNDLDELQNLLQFLLPDIFSRKEINQSADLQVCHTCWGGQPHAPIVWRQVVSFCLMQQLLGIKLSPAVPACKT